MGSRRDRADPTPASAPPRSWSCGRLDTVVARRAKQSARPHRTACARRCTRETRLDDTVPIPAPGARCSPKTERTQRACTTHGINETQIALVKLSWSQVEPIAPVAAGLFYDRLFSVTPGVRQLFPTGLTEQRRKLMKMIGMVVWASTGSRRSFPRCSSGAATGATAPRRSTTTSSGSACCGRFGKGAAWSSRQRSRTHGPRLTGCWQAR
jgi:hypothetical protein